jgi:DNA modification methylase
MIRFVHGDVFEQMPKIAPGSVDCVVTSVPYWKLRSYLVEDDPLKHLEIGQERTPALYVEKIAAVCDLVREAMADHATFWLNIGDKYIDDSKYGGATGGKHAKGLHGRTGIGRHKIDSGITAGNAALIPQRLAVALQDAGWIVRSVIAWWKPSPMPFSGCGWAWRRCRVRDQNFVAKEYAGKRPDGDSQSPAARMKRNTATMREHGGEHNNGAAGISDIGWMICPGCKKCSPTGGYVLRKGSWRPTNAYETILMLAKSAEYFSDGELLKTPSLGNKGSSFTNERDRALFEDLGQLEREESNAANIRDVWKLGLESLSKEELIELLTTGDGNMSDLWRISAEPLKSVKVNGEKIDHYAAFPTQLVRRCLLAGVSERGYCPTCGKPWARMLESNPMPHPSPRKKGRDAVDTKGGNQANGSAAVAPHTRTTGWMPSCQCAAAEPRPGLVLDPFAGSGRAALAAKWLGMDFIGIELNPKSVAMAEAIVNDGSRLFDFQEAT